MEDCSQRILAVSLGAKLPARRVQERSFTTTSFREPISQHRLLEGEEYVMASTVTEQPVSTAIEAYHSSFQSHEGADLCW